MLNKICTLRMIINLIFLSDRVKQYFKIDKVSSSETKNLYVLQTIL